MTLRADVHVHVWEEKQLGPLGEEFARIGGPSRDGLTVRLVDLLQDMDASDIDVAVVQGFRAVRQGALVPNAWVAEFARQSGGRLVPMATLDPTEATFEAQLDEAVALNVAGFKLLPSYGWFEIGDPRLSKLYRVAAERRLPVMMHLSAAVTREAMFEFAHPRRLERVCLEYPALTVVLAHMSYPWETEAFGLARRFPGVYFDISAYARRPRHLRTALADAAEYGLLGRLMYGSDSPFHVSGAHMTGMVTRIWDELAGDDDRFTGHALDALMGETAAATYGLTARRPRSSLT